jgi:tetratricopeptide (TPR) repeat protein
MSQNPDYTAHLIRGRMLREHSRYEDAIEYLDKAIGAQPDSDEAFVEKALCELQLDKPRAAKVSIDRAISLDPENAMAYAVKALVLVDLDRQRDGCAMAKKALSLEPHHPVFQRILGQTYLAQDKLDKAEHWLRKSLAEDPDDETAANLLTNLLRRQNRLDENQAHMQRLLEKNPENAFTHYNAGWSALQTGNIKQAEQHFRESLRLDPNFDPAREGLLQSFRARSLFYRLFLKYSFFMQRLSGGARWALVIGLIVAVKIGRNLLEKVHPSLAIALVAAYLIFVFWGFIASGLSNLIVLGDRNARHALKRADILAAVTVGGFFVTGLVMALGAVLVSIPIFIPISIGFAASAIPFSLCYNNDSKPGTILFAVLGSVTVMTGLVTGLTNIFAHEPSPFNPLLAICLLGCMLSTWLSSVKAVYR